MVNDQAVQKWLRGPPFLWKPEGEWTIQDKKEMILQNDPEIKTCLQINFISARNDILEALESRIYSSYKMKRVVAMVLRYKKFLKKDPKEESQVEMINSSLLKEADIQIIKMVQARKFAAEIKSLRPRDCSDGEGILKRNSKIFQLDLFLDEDGVLGVGGRLHKSYFNDDYNHPVLLPKKERITLFVMQWCHSKCADGGRGLALNELRSCGY